MVSTTRKLCMYLEFLMMSLSNDIHILTIVLTNQKILFMEKIFEKSKMLYTVKSLLKGALWGPCRLHRAIFMRFNNGNHSCYNVTAIYHMVNLRLVQTQASLRTLVIFYVVKASLSPRHCCTLTTWMSFSPNISQKSNLKLLLLLFYIIF